MVINKSNKSQNPGFTLLELIVVVAGLGILSSLAISNLNQYLEYNREDQASSLMNSLAADCLQKLRRTGNADGVIDENIMSYQKLQTFGYEFSQGDSPQALPSCESVSIAPSSNNTSPIIGFTINDLAGDDYGKLTKIATDRGDLVASARWAGANIRTDEEVEEWRELNERISEAKKECSDAVDAWLNADSSGYHPTWDDTKTSTCSSSPPATPDPRTCSDTGCNGDKRIYALDGEICGYTQKDYDECVERERGAACAAALEQIRKDKKTTQSINGDPVGGCENDIYWFYEGEDTGSADNWSNQMCKANKEQLLTTTHSGLVEFCGTTPVYVCGGEELSGENAEADFASCLAGNKDAQCTQALNDDALNKRSGGPYTSPTPEGMTAPIGKDCGEEYYYCKESGKIHRNPDAAEKYEADEKCEDNGGCIQDDFLCDFLGGTFCCD